MQATRFEFANRAMIFGCIIGVSFALYSFDHENATAILANWLVARLRMDPAMGIYADLLARVLFLLSALLLGAAALLRTWASSYLNASVVYASEVKSAWLVADGPYRYVRNPLYFANVLMAIGMGAMMSRSGLAACVVAMTVFCYRLILREEGELSASQGKPYDEYRRLVPRLWPAFGPRVPSTTRQPEWSAGFRAESWYWGFAVAMLGFALTLRPEVFFVVTAASIGCFWLLTRRKRS